MKIFVMSDVERFWGKVEKTDACWNWKAGISASTYPIFWFDGKQRLAHRIAYEITNGEISKGMVIDHLCSNRLCVRPDHLDPVTQRENIKRSSNHVAKKILQTHCINNHPFDKKNTYSWNGHRTCRICRYDRAQRRKMYA